ncbi:1-pyrroline-5-carboxylate dehydrogenase [Kwoniella dejecticola CBS 10117]|uniref:Multifunctional fusion protein n=1 Tax=Kwoniella dejecticola CBS 10117 TaxID=1296121 RepID=A0A1A6A9A5_9TREE|nr:1-pyrroline-5-carboxylate dehydrogenase [Kwoniella dejecticola CBS 10117]OBR86638.1 1-pyrroline-5-carboxylate dehydrogenase [Kwoniella dejecticola CBS 10117]
MSSQLASFRVPVIDNEPMRNYAVGSEERKGLQAAVDKMLKAAPFEVPCIINGKEVKTGDIQSQPMPHDHANPLCTYHAATAEVVNQAIEGALAAKQTWEELPWADKAAIFLKAADLIAGKYRYEIMAATMLGQGKNAWQAEIDAAAELCDFLRFSVKYVEELYTQQPPRNSNGVWNRVEFRPLEGFVLAVTPFNFTAIGGNLVGAPAIVGNTVVWKPSPMATYSNYIVHKIFIEAGLPPSVIQFVPGNPPEVVKQCIDHKAFAGLHFTGSTQIFRKLWKDISNNLDIYRGYPRIVGETGGKNFHLYHQSAEIKSGVHQAIRAAFEYSGQKCSALSRCYVPASMWNNGFKDLLVSETNKITIGPCTEWNHFTGPVIGKPAFEKITGIIAQAKKDGGEIIAGGSSDSSKGYFIQPTVILTKDPKSVSMTQEIFGPVLTVYVYEDSEYDNMPKLIQDTTEYALTGAIFAQERAALQSAAHKLRNAAGNFYINDKCTGAVVGQQPFGGAAASGTNDKSGSMAIFSRFVSMRSIKENFINPQDHLYPSNFV